MYHSVLEEIKKTKNYSVMYEDFIVRICKEEVLKYKNKKDVVKSVKKKLHIINGAFFDKDCHKLARRLMQDRDDDVKTICDSILRLHASSKERIGQLTEFYSEINRQVGVIDSIIDIGCGFNPFSLPWIKTSLDIRYYAYDINVLTIELLNDYFINYNIKGHAANLDIISEIPRQKAQVAFLFKLLPLLEQQKKGFNKEIIEKLNVNYVVITFPILSLTGKQKGMKDFYSNWFENGIKDNFNVLYKNVINNELIYIIKK